MACAQGCARANGGADLSDNACRGLSYQWDVQATVLRVAASMRERSFRVWVDTEMMTGSTLDAMAAAVENAHCILICVTERYKASANCRLEGTYVHEQRKPWVPLMLEASYKPTGWLGIMCV